MTISRQNIFDKCVGGVIKQGKASMSKDGLSCVYRSDDGCRCGAGQLISDRVYTPAMECNQFYRVLEKFDMPKYLKVHVELIGRIQMAHDDAAHRSTVKFMETFIVTARHIADSLNLAWNHGDDWPFKTVLEHDE